MHAANGSPVSIIRPSEKDWQQIPALLKTANFHRIGGPEMSRFVPDNCFIAKTPQNEVVGIAGYEILSQTSAKTTLLVVAPDLRAQGIGSQLQNTRIAFLKAQGIEDLFTNCDDDRVIAWNCKQFGFKPTGRLIPKEEDFGRNDRTFWTNLRLELNPDSHRMSPVFADDKTPVIDITDNQSDTELKQAASSVIGAMRNNADRYLTGHFTPVDNARQRVSQQALIPLLQQQAWVSDIVENRQPSNCIAFNFDNVDDAVMDNNLIQLR